MHAPRRLLVAVVLSLLGAVAVAQSGSAAAQNAANKALLEKYFADVNAHDLAALHAIIAKNYVQHGAYQGQSLAGMQAAFRHDFELFPDFHWTVEDSVVTKDRVVARFRITATHNHPVQFAAGAPVFPPTGKKLSWKGISI
jgi:predicted ester cyclase